MPKLSQFAGDPTRESQGVWLEYGANLWVKLGRAGTARYKKTMSEVQRPHRRKLRSGVDPTLEERCAKIAFAKTPLVHDWGIRANGEEDAEGNIISGAEDMLDDAGGVIECTPDAVLAAFKDPRNMDFWNWCLEVCTEGAIFQAKALEDSAGK